MLEAVIEKIGVFNKEVIEILELKIAENTPIYIGENNIAHIKKRHPYEYDCFFNEISNIIAKPDYVGRNPSDDSISFVKTYRMGSEYVRVAIRATSKGKFFVRSLHQLSTYNAQKYIKRGTLITLTNE